MYLSQAKKREWRIQDVVMPHLESLKPALYQSVLREMQKAGVRGTKEEIKATHANRAKQLVLSLFLKLIAVILPFHSWPPVGINCSPNIIVGLFLRCLPPH